MQILSTFYLEIMWKNRNHLDVVSRKIKCLATVHLFSNRIQYTLQYRSFTLQCPYVSNRTKKLIYRTNSLTRVNRAGTMCQVPQPLWQGKSFVFVPVTHWYFSCKPKFRTRLGKPIVCTSSQAYLFFVYVRYNLLFTIVFNICIGILLQVKFLFEDSLFLSSIRFYTGADKCVFWFWMYLCMFLGIHYIREILIGSSE